MIEKCKEDKKVIVQFSTSPLGKGISVSKFVAAALQEVKNSGYTYQLTPMATVIESDTLEEAINVILKAHEAVFQAGAKRVITDIKIDDRRDKPRKMEEKVKKVIKQLDNTHMQI